MSLPLVTPLPLQALSRRVLLERYAQRGESTPDAIQSRVAKALAAAEPVLLRGRWEEAFLQAQRDGFIPGGRINAAAGTALPDTLLNCFVHPLSLGVQPNGHDGGIFGAIKQAAQTLRLGGGIGHDFSPLPPSGGLLSCLHAFDRMCDAVSIGGSRPGAQMGVLRCDHPDIETFIHAKDLGGFATFNLSVACTDAFMHAVRKGHPWDLVHASPPSLPRLHAGARLRADGLWVHRTVPAEALFDDMVRCALDHGEPGLLFTDTVNRENNLSYCESIAAANPCAEQPLPPYGACALGSIDLCRLVSRPFGELSQFEFERFARLVKVSVRMLDNVLDVTHWPLLQHAQEALAKRRIGLGFTGLGDALIMLGLHYDSPQARDTAALIARTLRDAAYEASVALAQEKSVFPLFSAREFLASPHCASRLEPELQARIRLHGLRNSHLLSIAPTGSISLAFADSASPGIEPSWGWACARPPSSLSPSLDRAFAVEDPACRRFRLHHGLDDGVVLLPFDVRVAQRFGVRPGEVFASRAQRCALLSEAFVTATQLSPQAHLAMCAAVQPFIDAGISKTINLPRHSQASEVLRVCQDAWERGLKGLTVYRPPEGGDDGRGLSAQRAEPGFRGAPCFTPV